MGAYRDINILGTRGIPAAHGGFETFAQHLALYLRDRGWNVTVYCQLDAANAGAMEDDWNGIRRVHIGTANTGPLGTIQFDLRCVLDVIRRRLQQAKSTPAPGKGKCFPPGFSCN